MLKLIRKQSAERVNQHKRYDSCLFDWLCQDRSWARGLGSDNALISATASFAILREATVSAEDDGSH